MRLLAQLAMPLLAGLLHAAGVAWPLHGVLDYGQPQWALQLLSMALLAGALLGASSACQAALRAWAFTTVYLGCTFGWLFTAMHTYGGMPAPLAALAEWLLAGLLAIYFALASGLWWRLARRGAFSGALLFGLLWMMAELARGTWLTGFGWGAGGYAHVDGPLSFFAPLLGSYGIGAVAGFIGMALAQASLRAMGRRAPGGVRPSGTAALLTALTLLIAPLLLPVAWNQYTRDAGSFSVTLLQGGIAQDEKFEQSSGVPQALRWYEAQLLGAKSDLVVAPETAIPLLPQDLPEGYWQRLSTGLRDRGHAAIFGIPLGDSQQGYTNSAIGLMPGQAQVQRYDKHHLVPFGEFIPPLFRWFTNLMHIPLGDFNRGPLGQASFAMGGQRLAVHICYEDLFGEELATRFTDPANAPTALVNVSNLAWFGDGLAIHQHLSIARMRALEFGLPVLRATNTGATAIIAHTGVVQAQLPYTKAAVLQGQVQGRVGLTPFALWAARWGLWPQWLMGIAVLCWSAWLRPRQD
jgi:apolipoprotein N-acyltransferase